MYEAIPVKELPFQPASVTFVDEDFVSLSKYFGSDIIVEPYYFNKGFKGFSEDLYVRRGVAERLELAMTYLPYGFTFKVYDAWRPIKVQKSLYNAYVKQLMKTKKYTKEEAHEEAKIFVSVPTLDELYPAVHSTGGAIDLTLAEKKSKIELNMGCEFDSFDKKSYSAYFESATDVEACTNRRLLYNAMISAGFTNLPSEFWHYDYGDSNWAYYKKQPAKYRGMLYLNS